MTPSPLKNHPTLTDRVLQSIEQENLIPCGSGVLVAVSGGPDSMALLDLLSELKISPLRAAHLNHQLRPGECDLDEQLVIDYCRSHQIRLYNRSVDINAMAAMQGIGLEAAGRAARYQFFEDCINKWLSEESPPTVIRIAVAHHLDDQAETVMLHLGRGCGLDGFLGMKPQSGRLIRPLLQIRRDELKDYLKTQQVPWRQDKSNLELFTLRNRMRHLVLPQWQAALGYDPAGVLSRTAERVREDQQLLEELTEQAWQTVVVESDKIAWDLLAFRAIDAALQNRLLRRAWQTVSGEPKDIEWRHLKLARDFLNEPGRTSGHLDWPSGIMIDLSSKQVRFSHRTGRHK